MRYNERLLERRCCLRARAGFTYAAEAPLSDVAARRRRRGSGRRFREQYRTEDQDGQRQQRSQKHRQHGLNLSSSRRVTINEKACGRNRRDRDQQCAEDKDVGLDKVIGRGG